MDEVRVVGVPEHFNLPWHLAIEDKFFEREFLNIVWRDEPGGTGAMCKALRDETTDCCVLLTEGIITDIIRGNPSRIISSYVISPLIWGVHTGVDNPLTNYRESFDKRYAISRYGSGSHLMPQVDALTKEKKIPSNNFHVVGGLEGGLKSLAANETDVFYWEKYTTKPYVDSGQLRRIGEFLTPWPCFVIAATEKAIKEKPDALRRMLKVIHEENMRFMSDLEVVKHLVSERYSLRPQDVERWFHSTVWADHAWLNPHTIENVLYSLKKTGIIENGKPIEELIWIKS